MSSCDVTPKPKRRGAEATAPLRFYAIVDQRLGAAIAYGPTTPSTRRWNTKTVYTP
jgi:hypothetical protein